MQNIYIYIYKKLDTFQKSRQFTLLFYSKNARHFTLRDFSWNYWNWHLYKYKNHDTLSYMTFLYSQIQTLWKNQDNLGYGFFIYRKPDTLGYTKFLCIVEIGGGGGGIFLNKKKAFCVKCLYAKNNALSVPLLYTKSQTLCVTFLYAKNNALFVRVLYLKFIV